MAKNILIFTNHFFPEEFKVNDIAFHWARKGHKVTVVTGLPNYPYGKIFKGYGIFSKANEYVNGVKVIRLPLIPRGKGGGVRLALNYLTYLCSLLVFLPFLFFRKIDSVFVHHTSPIFIGIPAVLLSKIKRIPLFFWNLDLWPESVIAAGGLKEQSFVIRMLNILVVWIYHNTSVLFISSRGFKEAILSKITMPIDIQYLPNWAEDSFDNVKIQSIPDFEILNPAMHKIVFAGNMGEAHNLDIVLKTIELCKNLNVYWLMVGDGRARASFFDKVNELNLATKVKWMGRYPIEMMPSIYNYADVMLLSLKDEVIFKYTLPARVQSYLASKKCIIGMISGEGMQVINDSNCGFCVESGDFEGLARTVKEISLLSRDSLDQYGINGYNYYRDNFTKEKVLQRLDYFLNKFN